MEIDTENQIDLEISKYQTKFADYLNPNDAYQFYLKCQFFFPKIGKQKNDIRLFAFSIFSISHLSNLNQAESCLSLLDQSMTIYKQNHPDKNILSTTEQKEFYVKKFMKLYKLVPTKTDKTIFKYNFLQLCEKNSIEESMLMAYNVYDLFSMDSIDNHYFLQGYKFALKAKNLKLLLMDINLWFEIKPDDFKDFEKNYFITRVCFEILLMKQHILAKKFISNFVDTKDQLIHNSKVLNFAFLLCNLLNSENEKDCNWDNFNKLYEDYKICLDVDKDYCKYIDNISKLYFNKGSSQSGGFSFFNFLSALAD